MYLNVWTFSGVARRFKTVNALFSTFLEDDKAGNGGLALNYG
jgi:hypothetical protein